MLKISVRQGGAMSPRLVLRNKGLVAPIKAQIIKRGAGAQCGKEVLRAIALFIEAIVRVALFQGVAPASVAFVASISRVTLWPAWPS